jgi:hypothetical protein
MEILSTLNELTGSSLITAIIGSFILNVCLYLLSKILKKTFYFLTGYHFAQGKEQLTTSKVGFVREIVNWCIINLGLASKTNSAPSVQLLYYKHSKICGIYYSYGKNIVIYWGSHSTLMEIIDTTIHEYQHYLDLQNQKDAKAYDKESNVVGYFNNYFEVRARNTAAKHRDSCYEALKKKKIII